MGSLYKRGTIWWVKYYRNGRPIRESTGTDKEGEARRFLKHREGAVAAGKPIIPRADRVRFDELAADFLNDYQVNNKRGQKNARRYVTVLGEHFGGCRMASITTADVRAYIAKRQEQGVTNATVNRELAALKRMFSLGLQSEKILRRPYIPTLAENNARQGFFSEIDFLALQEALPEYLRPVAGFGYITGWRKGEILGLPWTRISFQEEVVRLEPGTTKNREGRTIVMTSALKALLKAQWEKTRALVERRKPGATPREVAEMIPWVFHREGHPIRNFDTAWRTACERAGLPGRLFHDLRRTAIRNMVRAGIPERVAMMMSGHRTRAIFERYDIVSETDLREAADRLNQGVPGTISGTIEAQEGMVRVGLAG